MHIVKQKQQSNHFKYSYNKRKRISNLFYKNNLNNNQ